MNPVPMTAISILASRTAVSAVFLPSQRRRLRAGRYDCRSERGRMDDREVLVRGGEVLDGTGAAAVRADVRVRDGRIVEVGPNLSPDGAESFDASGAVVAPGFIDSHAHTDPQVFWDPAIDPDPLHGV